MDSQPFEKAAGAPCSFLCQTPEGSCSIYTKRPAVCQAFTCAWMEGVGAPNDRPNQLGVLLMRKHGKGDVHTQWPHGVATIVAVACEGDDPERKGAWHLILRISAVFPVLLQQGEDLLGLVCPNPSARRAIQGAIPSLPVLTTNPWASA